MGKVYVRLAIVIASLAGAARGQAFCGFFVAGSNEKLINNASQVALVRDGNHTALTMSNTYKGPPESFAMVVPVPVVLMPSAAASAGMALPKSSREVKSPSHGVTIEAQFAVGEYEILTLSAKESDGLAPPHH